jgi:hypothetical protein
VVGTKTRLNLWENYARCYFDYFAPTIMICDQSSKFERLYTKSLKKALDLPLHLPNDVLLRIAGVPSLLQIAGHHVLNTTATIQNRFGRSPSSLLDLAASLMHTEEEYQARSNPEPIRALTGNSFVVDLQGHF